MSSHPSIIAPSPSLPQYTPNSSTSSTPTLSLDSSLGKARSHAYPKYGVILVLSIILAATMYNALSSLLTYLRLRQDLQAEKMTFEESKVKGDKFPSEESGGESHKGSHIALRVPQAALSAARLIACRKTSSPLIEAVIIGGYIFAMLLFEFVNSRNVHGLLDPTFWANRAGTLAVSQLVFIIALSGKNNLISVLTGISFEKLSILHRAASRTVLLLIWIHIWGHCDLGITGKQSFKFGWMRAGALSTVALTLASLFGTRQLRNKSYDLFLAGHITLVFIFLISTYFHVTVAAAFLPYVWSAILLWVIDRSIRFARILRLRMISKKLQGTHANAILDILSADTISVRVRLSSSSQLQPRWNAGQSAYLSIPAASRLGVSLEAHPFTISSIDEPRSATGMGSFSPSYSESDDSGFDKESEMRFIIRKREGFTRRLHELADRSCQVSAFIDGPYGSPPDVRASAVVMLIAGGSGVSFTLPLLLDLGRRSRNRDNSILCERVLFIWVVREECHVNWILEDLTAVSMAGQNINIDIRIFVTGGRKEVKHNDIHSLAESETQKRHRTLSHAKGALVPVSTESDTFNKGSEGAHIDIPLWDNGLISFVFSRPNIEKILEDEIISSRNSSSISVCASGPQSLTDSIRKTLGESRITGPSIVLHGGPNILLHIEQFGM